MGIKAYICCSEAMILGHLCSYEEKKLQEKMAETVLTWPECKDKSDMKAFLGTASQLRMFIQNFAKKVVPLTKLTSDLPWEWGDEQREAMDLLKEGIRKAPVL